MLLRQIVSSATSRHRLLPVFCTPGRILPGAPAGSRPGSSAAALERRLNVGVCVAGLRRLRRRVRRLWGAGGALRRHPRPRGGRRRRRWLMVTRRRQTRILSSRAEIGGFQEREGSSFRLRIRVWRKLLWTSQSGACYAGRIGFIFISLPTSLQLL